MDFSFDIKYSYPVIFTRNLFHPSNTVLLESLGEEFNGKSLFLFEKELTRLFPDLPAAMEEYISRHDNLLRTAGPIQIIEGGEQNKCIETVLELCRCFAQFKICRQSVIIIIGGGAFLDICGMAAAIFHRGISQIRIPTTGLSQCDSGVGVKNGVNALGLKNLLGCFAPPRAVLNDACFLTKLTPAMITACAMEAVKVALIKDISFFQWLTVNANKIISGNFSLLEEMVQRSALIHAKHIATNGDPFETGNARPLDFGHWAAHQLENLSSGKIPHGIAVGMGMLIDTLYAARIGLCSLEIYQTLHKLLKDFQLPFYMSYLTMKDAYGSYAILDGLEAFREHIGGELCITLPIAFGSKIEVNEMNIQVLEKVIEDVSSNWTSIPV